VTTPVEERPTILVRPEEPSDVDRVREVVAAAFGDEPVAELLDALRASSAWRELPFVAVRDGQVVGHVSYTRGWLDSPERLHEVLVLSPLSVHPDGQGHGVGSELVRRSLARLEDRPEPLVFLEGSPAYYGRLGFRAGGDAGFTPPSRRIPPAAFQYVPLPPYLSSMTGALVYPDAFWEHDSVGLREHPAEGPRIRE
jgi:putative acetyltransferase